MAQFVEGDREGWGRVAEAVRNRRGELDLTQIEAGTRGNVAVTTFIKLENCQNLRYQGLVIAGVERAMGWRSGSIDRLLTDPDYQPEPAAVLADEDLEQRFSKVEEGLRKALSNQAQMENRLEDLQKDVDLLVDAWANLRKSYRQPH